MCGKLANDGEFVGRVPFQGVGLEVEQRRKCQKQHGGCDRHDQEGDFLPNWAIAQVLHAFGNSRVDHSRS